MENLSKVPLDKDDDKYFRPGASLSPEQRNELVSLLREYADVFAWSKYEMPGIPPEVACHQLNVDPSFKPIKQKLRRSAQQHQEVVKEEAARL